jgi:hypothetical protein
MGLMEKNMAIGGVPGDFDGKKVVEIVICADLELLSNVADQVVNKGWLTDNGCQHER